MPLEQIIAPSRVRGVPMLVDAAQFSPPLPIGVQALDAVVLVRSDHKIFEPTGIGILVPTSARSAIFRIAVEDPRRKHRHRVGRHPVSIAGHAFQLMSGLFRDDHRRAVNLAPRVPRPAASA